MILGPAGFRRRGRRRGLVVGAALGATVASRRAASSPQQQQQDQEQYVNEPQAEQSAVSAGSDMDNQLEQLEKLGQLKSSGVLSEEEFEAKKKDILNQ